MAERAVISVSVTRETQERLARAAERSRRSPSSVAAEAIEHYLAVQDRHAAEIEAGLDELDRGQGIPHEEIVSWVLSLEGSR